MTVAGNDSFAMASTSSTSGGATTSAALARGIAPTDAGQVHTQELVSRGTLPVEFYTPYIHTIGVAANYFDEWTKIVWRTEQAYRMWARRWAQWLEREGRHGGNVFQAEEAEVRDFLSDLATRQRVAVATQKQALNALVFLVREALGRPLGDFGEFTAARAPKRRRVTKPSRAAKERRLEAKRRAGEKKRRRRSHDE